MILYIFFFYMFIAWNPLQIQAVAMDFVVEVLVSIPWNKILLLNSLSDVNHLGSLNLKHEPLCVRYLDIIASKASMGLVYTYIFHKNQLNVGSIYHTLHGSYGYLEYQLVFAGYCPSTT